MRITKTLLKNAGACWSQQQAFAEKFPTGVTVTVALCVEHAQDFNWGWAAEHMLPQAEYEAYIRGSTAANALCLAQQNASPAYPDAKASVAAWDRITALRETARQAVRTHQNVGRAIMFGILASAIPDKKKSTRPAAKPTKKAKR